MERRHVMLFLSPICLFVVAVFLLPLANVVWISLDGAALSTRAYEEVLSSSLFASILWNTFEISFGSTLLAVLLGYPIAFHLSRTAPRRRAFYLVLVLLPFWTSILVKSFAFTVILGERGIINDLLRLFTGPDYYLPMLFNRAGVTIGMAHFLIPFVVFPVLASLLAQSPDLPKAAQVMGAKRLRIFLRIVLPLSMPGVLAGAIMSMVLSMGMFVTPALLGGRKDMMMANLVDFYTRITLDWGIASAVAIVLFLLSGLFILGLTRLPGEHKII